MNKILLFLLTCTMLLNANVDANSVDTDYELLEGTWLPIEGELGGQKFPETVLKTMSLMMRGNKYNVKAGEQLDNGTIKLTTTAKPKEIDISSTEGANKGKTFLAIYDLAGDTLRVCYDLSGKSRPTEFKTAPGSTQLLLNYKREKR